MMSIRGPVDIQKLISVLESNHLLDAEQMAKVNSSSEGPENLLKGWVEDGTLTSWQAKRIAAGKTNFRLLDFRLLDWLGQDAWGDVYLGSDHQGRMFRIRLITSSTGDRNDKLEQFLDRVKLFQNLPENATAFSIEVFRTKKRILIVSPAPQGKTLRQMLADNLLQRNSVELIIGTLVSDLAAFRSAGLEHCSICEDALYFDDDGKVYLDLPKDIGWHATPDDLADSDNVALCLLASRLMETLKNKNSESCNTTNGKQKVAQSSPRPERGEPAEDEHPVAPLPAALQRKKQHDQHIQVAQLSSVESPIAESVDELSDEPRSSDTQTNGPPAVPPPPTKDPTVAVPVVEATTESKPGHSAMKPEKNGAPTKTTLIIAGLIGVILILSVAIIYQLGKPNTNSSTAKASSKSKKPLKQPPKTILNAESTDNKNEVNKESTRQKGGLNAKSGLNQSSVLLHDVETRPAKDDSELLGNRPNAVSEKKSPEESKDQQATPDRNKMQDDKDPSPKPEKVDPGKTKQTQPKSNPVLLIGGKDKAKPQPSRSQKAVLMQPFRDVPSSITLPSPQSPAPKTLFPIHLPENFPLVLRLHGGFFAAQGNFEFDLRGSTSEDRTWMIFGGPKGELQQIAKFFVQNNQLEFAWKPVAAQLDYSRALKNCGIGLKAGDLACNVALRRPVTLPKLDFSKSLNTTLQTKLSDLPNLDHVKISLVRLPQKLNGFATDANKKSLTGRADSMDLMYRVQNIPVFKMNLTSRFDDQSGLRIRAISHVITADRREIKLTSLKNLQELIKKGNLEADAILQSFKDMVEKNKKNPNAQARANFTRSKQFKDQAAKSKTAQNIKKQAAQSLNVGTQLDRAQLGLRILYDAGEMKIELAKSKWAPTNNQSKQAPQKQKQAKKK